MRSFWRKAGLGLLLVVMIGVLAACTDTKKESNEEPEKTEEGKTVIKVVYKDDCPSVPAAVTYYDKLEVALKQDLDLDIEFDIVEIAQGDYAEKLNILLYSGEIPDLIYFQGGDQQITNQDLLEDLTPYIEKSKYIKDILQPQNEARLSNYPYLLWIKSIDHKVPVVRKDFFDKMESSVALKENPTVENYKDFFKELVEGDHVENAVTVAGDISELNYIFNMAFGINQSWLETDDGYIYSKVSEQEKEKLAFYRELYEEGLLDQQYLTKQWDTKEDAFYTGETGVIVGTNGKVIDLYNNRITSVNGEQAELVILPPAKGEFQGFGATNTTKESRGLAISSQSPNKEVVFEILDYLASPAGQKLDRLGYEGEHYELVDNEIVLNDTYYGDWWARFWEPVDLNVDISVSEDTPMLSVPAAESQDLASSYYTEDNAFIIPEENIPQWDAIENLYKEYSADIITGKKPLDAFDEFVEEWYANGGDALTKIANESIK